MIAINCEHIQIGDDNNKKMKNSQKILNLACIYEEFYVCQFGLYFFTAVVIIMSPIQTHENWTADKNDEKQTKNNKKLCISNPYLFGLAYPFCVWMRNSRKSSIFSEPKNIIHIRTSYTPYLIQCCRFDCIRR